MKKIGVSPEKLKQVIKYFFIYLIRTTNEAKEAVRRREFSKEWDNFHTFTGKNRYLKGYSGNNENIGKDKHTDYIDKHLIIF